MDRRHWESFPKLRALILVAHAITLDEPGMAPAAFAVAMRDAVPAMDEIVRAEKPTLRTDPALVLHNRLYLHNHQPRPEGGYSRRRHPRHPANDERLSGLVAELAGRIGRGERLGRRALDEIPRKNESIR